MGTPYITMASIANKNLVATDRTGKRIPCESSGRNQIHVIRLHMDHASLAAKSPSLGYLTPGPTTGRLTWGLIQGGPFRHHVTRIILIVRKWQMTCSKSIN